MEINNEIEQNFNYDEDAHENILHVSVNVVSVKDGYMSGYIEMRGNDANWNFNRTIETSDCFPNNLCAAEVRTLLKAITMIKRYKFEKRFSIIKYISDDKKLLRNMNKGKAVVNEMVQDAGGLLAEIIKLVQPMRKKMNLCIIIEI